MTRGHPLFEQVPGVTGETGAPTEEELSRVPKEADVYTRIARQIQDALDQVEFQKG